MHGVVDIDVDIVHKMGMTKYITGLSGLTGAIFDITSRMARQLYSV